MPLPLAALRLLECQYGMRFLANEATLLSSLSAQPCALILAQANLQSSHTPNAQYVTFHTNARALCQGCLFTCMDIPSVGVQRGVCLEETEIRVQAVTMSCPTIRFWVCIIAFALNLVSSLLIQLCSHVVRHGRVFSKAPYASQNSLPLASSNDKQPCPC